MSRNTLGSVVVVDDDVAYLHTLALMLRVIGFDKIDTFENGFDAMEAIEKSKPNLVISDWDMPIMNGIDLLTLIRADSDLKDIPFMMNTGHLDQERWKEAIKCGVTEFLFKPFSFDDFKSSVLLALELAESERASNTIVKKLAS